MSTFQNPSAEALPPMNLRFTKMHGLGNDFVVIDLINQSLTFTNELAHHLADRRFGIGCDQVLLVEQSDRDDVDFRYRIFNADGSEVEQCGNGARCFARFMHDKGLTDKDTIRVETASGIIEPRIEGPEQVTVDMGAPILSPPAIPFAAEQQSPSYAIDVAGRTERIGAVSMGNPHAVLIVDDVTTAPVETLGPALESHPRFPNRVNVGFMQINDRQHIALRVFERGTGETLACGTGACAAVVAGRVQGLLDETVQVTLPGGNLMISWRKSDTENPAPVLMTGPAVRVFEGEIEL